MTYAAWVLLGVVASWLAARRTRVLSGLDPSVARKLRWVALAGAIAGAYLCELPADLLGLAPPTSDAHPRWGGRTLLGGLLFGWAAVELAKRRLGQRTPTGDAFALPLAAGLAIGRLGCVFGGCCPGRLIEADSLLALPARLLHGEPRFPAALLEAYFHGIWAVLLLLARPGPRRGRLLPAYLAAYALLRLWLETERDVPRPFAGLSYYQLLALGLFCLAAATWLGRTLPTSSRQRDAAVPGASRERSAGQRAAAADTSIAEP